MALALAGLAQSGKGTVPARNFFICRETHCLEDLSVERVAALAQENALPVPVLDLGSLGPSTSGFGQYQVPTQPIRAPIPTRGYSAEDPWNVSKVTSSGPTNGNGSQSNGVSSIAGTGLPRDWWRKQEVVNVNILGQQGFILNRYLVYEVSTDVSSIPSLCTASPSSSCNSYSGRPLSPGAIQSLSSYGTVL